MTVSYNGDMIDTHSLTFLRVIFRWRGSLWKSVVVYEVTLWLLCYYTVLFVYRFQLKKEHQVAFEHIAKHTDQKMDYIPLSFMHGFYVAFVVDRWKQIFSNIGFVDSAAFWIAHYVVGRDEEVRTYRRNMIRYLILTQVMVLRDISVPVRKRYPDDASLVRAGLLHEHEAEMMRSSVREADNYPRYWVPIHWIFTLGHRLVQQGHTTAGQLEMLLVETKQFREKLQLLINYDWVPVPLAYSQVVFMATRVYFFLCLFSRQFRIWEQKDSVVYLEYYVPLMTLLQLVCYMGWLKVAEGLLNPLGEDDDDFECNYIVDRNLAIGRSMVDECYAQLPEQMPDGVGQERAESPPPYAEECPVDPQHQLIGSAQLVANQQQCQQRKMTLSDLLAERKSPANPERKRSLFMRMLRRTVGSNGEGRKRSVSFGNETEGRAMPSANRRQSAFPALSTNAQPSPPQTARRSNSVACAPFTTSYDNLDQLKKVLPKNVTISPEAIGDDIADSFAPPMTPKITLPSPLAKMGNFDFSHGAVAHLDTLSENDEEESGKSEDSAASIGMAQMEEGRGGHEAQESAPSASGDRSGGERDRL